MTITAPAQPTDRPGALRAMAPIARDIAIPIGGYFALRALGCSDFLALAAGAVWSAGVTVVGVVRARRIDPMAAVMLGVFAIGLVGALISGDARIMIIKDSVGTAVVGVAFLISAAMHRPMTYVAARKTMTGEKLAGFEAAYRTKPSMRRAFEQLAVLWGAGLFGEAVLRVVLALRLPVATMAWLSSVLMVVTIGGLTVITARVVKRLRAAAAAAESSPAQLDSLA